MSEDGWMIRVKGGPNSSVANLETYPTLHYFPLKKALLAWVVKFFKALYWSLISIVVPIPRDLLFNPATPFHSYFSQ